ncbi:MAG TPA: FAD-dependent oxidoreductase [Candidatus Binataceae bacterium]|nr:FAD-dependent oxidoreductase [Candidatus Binataceae bacterium]
MKLSRHWGEALWRRAKLIPAGASIPATPDVAIIGGGATGLSAAYHLARRGLRAVVFEADRVGSGASGRTGGIVLEGTATGPRPGARDCVPQLERLVTDLGIECDLRLPGCWEIVHQARGGGRRLPWFDDGAAISVARTVAGGSIEPGAMVAGLAEAAIAAGAIVFEHRRVAALKLSAAPALEVEGEEIHPGYVIVALNAWTATLIPRMPALRSALTYACLTAPLDDATLTSLGLDERMPFYTADTPYLWGRVCDGSIVFGAGLSFSEPDELERLEISGSDSVAILEWLEGRVRALNPALARVPIVARWAGPIAFREGLIPLLMRHPKAERVLIAGAYAGHGVAFSVHAGALMAAAIVDGAPLPSWGISDIKSA